MSKYAECDLGYIIKVPDTTRIGRDVCIKHCRVEFSGDYRCQGDSRFEIVSEQEYKDRQARIAKRNHK